MTGRGAQKAQGVYYTPAPVVTHALLALPRPRRLLDLACGDGAWLAAAGRRWPAAALVGVDLDPVAVARAAERVPRARLIVADALEVSVDTADLVVGNPPWGAGRAAGVRRGAESASARLARSAAGPDGAVAAREIDERVMDLFALRERLRVMCRRS